MGTSRNGQWIGFTASPLACRADPADGRGVIVSIAPAGRRIVDEVRGAKIAIIDDVRAARPKGHRRAPSQVLGPLAAFAEAEEGL